jgi:hypothetical protein
LPFWLKPIEAQVPLHILAHFHLIFALRGADGELEKKGGTLQIVSDSGSFRSF